MISASLITLIQDILQVYAKSAVSQVTGSEHGGHCGHHLTFSWFIIGDQATASNPIRTYLAESPMIGNITAVGSYHGKLLKFLPVAVADRGI